MKCPYCTGIIIKKGKRGEIQRYQCTSCGKNIQEKYVKPRLTQEQYNSVFKFHKEGCSISSISRLLEITKSSVQRIIERLSKRIEEHKPKENGESYEIDELCTYCGNKQNHRWIIYAINRRTNQKIEIKTGRRTKENIKKVVDRVLSLKPKHIYTDRLNIYTHLIEKQIHKIYPHCTNHIERMNVNLRNQLKRLSRRTICYSKSEKMLDFSVRLWTYSQQNQQ